MKGWCAAFRGWDLEGMWQEVQPLEPTHIPKQYLKSASESISRISWVAFSGFLFPKLKEHLAHQLSLTYHPLGFMMVIESQPLQPNPTKPKALERSSSATWRRSMLPGWVPTAAPWHSAAQALYANLTTAGHSSDPTGATKLNKTVI